MQYVVCYDVSDDMRRGRLANVLLDFGVRVQESVFVAHLDDELALRMKERIASAVNLDFDRVHVFPLCALCEAKVWVVGRSVTTADPEFYIV